MRVGVQVICAIFQFIKEKLYICHNYKENSTILYMLQIYKC